MRISLVSIGTTGAGPVYSLEMAKALTESKHCQLQVIISSHISNLAQWIDYFRQHLDVDFQVIETYQHSTWAVLKTMYFDWDKKANMVNLIRHFKADVLYIPFGLMWAPYVFKKIHQDVRIVTTLHDPHPHDSLIGGFKWFVFRNMPGQKSSQFVDDIVILNKKDVEFVKNKTGKNVTVIPHASFSYYVKDNNTDYSIKNTIGFFGRIEPYKGLDLLVEAFEKQSNPNLKLLIAGSGGIEESLKSRILNNDRIELINRYIEDDEFQSLIDRIDFVVLPYKRASQSGVIPMAFAFGKTVIATNVGALDEQVPEGTGVLVAPDSAKISIAINELYSKPSQISTYGRNAQHYAQTELTWEHSAKLLLDYLES